MDISKRHFVTMSYDISTINVPKEMTQAQISVSRFEARARTSIQPLMDDSQLRNLIVNVWPKLNATVSLNPNVDKAAYDKYLIDLNVAAIIDRKLMVFLKKEAAEIFKHIESNKANLLKRLDHLRAKEEEARRLQDEAFLREKELLLASLNLAITNIDMDLSRILGDCLSQIKFLQGRIENIQQQKRVIYHNLGQEVAKVFNQDAFKINGKSLFEIDPSLPPEERKEKEAQLGEHFNREVIPLHQEIKALEQQQAQVQRDRIKAEKALELELKRQQENPIDLMTDEEIHKELQDLDKHEDATEDEIIARLEQEEKDLSEAEKHADEAEKVVDKLIKDQEQAKGVASQAKFKVKEFAKTLVQDEKRQKLESKKQVVMKDMDKTDRKLYDIEKKRAELQKRRNKLNQQVEKFEDKAARHNIHAKILEDKPYNFITWNARAKLAQRRRKQIEKFEHKIARYHTEEHRLKDIKKDLSEKFSNTIGKIRNLFSHHKSSEVSDKQAAEKAMEALDRHPELGKKETAQLQALDKVEEDYRNQVQQCHDHAMEAKNKSDSHRSFVVLEKQALTGKGTLANTNNEKMHADIQALYTMNNSDKTPKRTKSFGT